MYSSRDRNIATRGNYSNLYLSETLIKAFFFTLNEFFLAEVTCIEQSRSSTDCSINFVFVSFVSFHDTAPGGGGESS